MAKHDSLTTTWNHHDWHVTKASCKWCGSDILEAKPISGPWNSRGKRLECYQCLARWWGERLSGVEKLAANQQPRRLRN